MGKPTTPIDKPTRRTVETLLREMSCRSNRYRDSEYQKLDDALDALRDEILKKNKGYQNLKRRRDRARAEYYDTSGERRRAVEAVRLKYLANGLTDEVQKALNELVKKYGQ